MKVLLDTNIVLDVLLNRTPHATTAITIFQRIEEGRLEGLLCATTITTIDYLLTQSLSRTEAKKHLSQLIRLFDIASVNRAVIERALKSRIDDFEDAVLEQAGFLASADLIISRNVKDFAHSAMTVLDPKQFLAQFP